MSTASHSPLSPSTGAVAPHAAAGRSLALVLWLGFAGLALALGLLLAGGTLPAGIGSLPGLSAVIGLLTLFVAAIVVTFSLRYMRADRRPAAYFGGIALLIASVMLFVFARHLVVLGIGWLASGVLLARLVGHDTAWSEARGAARRALLTFAVGDAALVVALVLLVSQTGTAQVDAVLAAVPSLPGWVTLSAALLLLVAAAARCALPPFAGWLLSSMTAPTPVSALMHAGLVNAGGFLLIRFAPVFEAAPIARAAAVAIGLVAALYGVGVMSVRPDIKRSLAGSTVSQMGFMIMSCGLGAYAAALWHIVAHGLFKAWLFLGSGSSVGMRGDKPAGLGEPATIGGVAVATLAVGAWLTLSPDASGSLVPLLLGLATALATLVEGLTGNIPLRARLAIGGLVAALIGFHAAGLAAMHALLGADAPSLLPPWALLALLGAFLAAWMWQQLRQARARPLPAALYVHLLNAGSAPAPALQTAEI
ncbi:proton-conducting transporter transmembrane domain-containing protein [Novosphingobium aerophilum]|uniref:Oxidoreductase n=1 Tax=Novosphingobium aerophilum TaxID=2839843 RepID=A0A7X1F6J7_9SPHN|nr:proton-conducting transporter membrane subunit [Novosphingobium aerophilum]MBC2651278.1 oxidoreductase [Novosphingobium aerophilum]